MLGYVTQYSIVAQLYFSKTTLCRNEEQKGLPSKTA